MNRVGILRHGSHMRHKLRQAAKKRAPRRVKLGDFSPWPPVRPGQFVEVQAGFDWWRA